MSTYRFLGAFGLATLVVVPGEAVAQVPGYVTLTVTRATNGTIYGPGIVCGSQGSTCSVVLPTGATISQQAVPDPPATFQGWMGAGCAETMVVNTNMTCTPNFGQAPGAQRIGTATVSHATQQLTITGANFGTPPQVWLDETPLTIVTASPSEIVVTLPIAS
jgi:hypothetical protein